MPMQSYRLQITPQSAFATELLGDTLFGQLCWAIRNRLGEKHLEKLLAGYTDNQPFAIISNAFPHGMIPRPTLPAVYFNKVDDRQRKQLKKCTWLPVTAIQEPLATWQQHCQSTNNISKKEQKLQPHNTINRLTETTGEGAFAPYTMKQHWYTPDTLLDIYVLFDDERCTAEQLHTCFSDIGCFGYGRDASIGLGKYRIDSFEPIRLPQQQNANACLTLAPCAPQGITHIDAQCSFYQLFTRFGRHGDSAAHANAKPFKNPVLMTQAGGVFSTAFTDTGFIGQGLGGEGQLSKSIAATVHQGYAPTIAVHLPPLTEEK